MVFIELIVVLIILGLFDKRKSVQVNKKVAEMTA